MNNIEVSLEGDENFINEYSDVIDHLLSKIKSGEKSKQKSQETPLEESGNTETKEDLEDFAMNFNPEQPSDNAHLITAYHYSIYGSDPISFEEVRNMADEAGIIIPDRVDMTLKKATKEGNSLYNNAGRGKVKPTIHGQKFFQEEYGVSKGTGAKTEEE